MFLLQVFQYICCGDCEVFSQSDVSRNFIETPHNKETTEEMTETVNIIGAGIGGLTTALTLKQRGMNVNIFESSAEIKPVGAGIILANNAIQVFHKLGIQYKIEKAGNKISYMKIMVKQLNNISAVDLSEYEKNMVCIILPFTEVNYKKYLPTKLAMTILIYQNAFQK